MSNKTVNIDINSLLKSIKPNERMEELKILAKIYILSKHKQFRFSEAVRLFKSLGYVKKQYAKRDVEEMLGEYVGNDADIQDAYKIILSKVVIHEYIN